MWLCCVGVVLVLGCGVGVCRVLAPPVVESLLCVVSKIIRYLHYFAVVGVFTLLSFQGHLFFTDVLIACWKMLFRSLNTFPFR